MSKASKSGKSKASKRKGTRKAGDIQPFEKLVVGIDMHKKTHSVAIWSDDRQAIAWKTSLPASAAGMLKLLERFREQIRLIVYEAGPTGFSLARTLLDNGLPAQVVSAAHTPESRGDQEKSDRYDAMKLARFGALGLLQEVYIPTEAEEGERAVSRLRENAAKDIRRKKQQIRSQLLRLGVKEPEKLSNWSKKAREELRQLPLREDERFVLDYYLDELEHLEERRKKIEEQIRKISKREHYKERLKALCALAGIGLISAMTYLTEMPAPERLRNGRQVGKYCGLAPLVRSSGETRREMGRNKCGNPRLRTMLVEAAWRWIGKDEYGKKRYERHLRNTASKKKAIVATARHLGIIMWKMIVTGKPYCPEGSAAAA